MLPGGLKISVLLDAASVGPAAKRASQRTVARQVMMRDLYEEVSARIIAELEAGGMVCSRRDWRTKA